MDTRLLNYHPLSNGHEELRIQSRQETGRRQEPGWEAEARALAIHLPPTNAVESKVGTSLSLQREEHQGL